MHTPAPLRVQRSSAESEGTSMRHLLTLIAVTLLTTCGLPPRYEGSEPLYSVDLLSHWTESNPPVNYDGANIAVITWRVGRDAPLPRTWEADSNCRVTEGTWRDTDVAPPSHGKTTLTGAAEKPQVFGDGRIASGLDLPDVQKPGAAYTLTAEGGTLPAYTLTGTLGDELTLTSHPIATAKRNELRFSRAAALPITWDAQASGEVFLGLFQYTPDMNQDYFHMIMCHWPASAGAATVPAEAMGSLVPQKQTSFSWLGFGSLARDVRQMDRVEVEGLMFHGRGVRVIVE